MDINTRIEELQRQLKEAERRAEQAEGIAENAKARAEEAEHLRENERRLRQALENRINLTTFETFLRSCHEYITVPLNIQPKKSKTTKGSITAPTGRYCPTTLRRWTDFPRLRNELFNRVFSLFHPTEAPPLKVFPSTEVVRGVGDLVSRRRLGSELDLLSYERFAVEEHVISIMQELLKLDTGTHLPLLGSGISFENHANTLNDEVETLLFIIEYKAGHKLLPANLRAGLQPSNFWEDVVQAHLIPTDQEEKLIYKAKQITGAAITQAFDYMIKEGVEYGYLTTGEVFTFLHIKEDDPTTLYYHLSEPKRDQEWRSHAFSILHTWAIDVEYILAKMPAEERSRTPSGSSFVPSSPLSSPIQQEQSRRSRRLQGRCADSDDTAEDSPSDSSEGDDPSNRNAMSKWGSKRFAVVISPPRPPAAKRQQQSLNREPERQYCTQKCLAGLANRAALDQACPNITLHRTMSQDDNHPILTARVAALLEAQLNNDRDNGCRPLKFFGAYGILFKMTLAKYGYTFVGKGTIEGLIHHLQHEAKVYEYLSKLQGSLIPVCLGSVNLKEPFITDGLDRIVHYLLLSWAGDSLDYSQHCDFHQEARRLQKELGRYGVVHGDVRPANVTWNSELSRPMLIDFDKARLVRKRPLTSSRPKATHSHAIKRKRRSLFQVDV
uniref:Protein kinase domain-containing protein n=1 Tax=Coccidioides posadasii RMSCC 3488 TaxID=454284 RepID=A0A0J6IAI8_COCPO|nr:conserved hypothetical protein, variant [Coccidioides posadasii RMSCC 3488]